MPLVRSKVTAKVETTGGVMTHPHVHYVKPKDVRPGDEIVEPTEKQRKEVEEQDGGVSVAVAAGDISELTKKELLAVAKRRGIEVSGRASRDAILAAIKAAQE